MDGDVPQVLSRGLEQGKFGIRQSLVYRRYLNVVRGRIARCRERATQAHGVVEARKKEYETKLHDREAVDELLRRRRERAAQERARRSARALDELAQNAWARGR